MGKFKLILLALGVSLVSCENLYDWDPGVSHTPKLTVFAHLRPGAEPVALVGRTFPAGSPVASPWLEGAVVTLYANGLLVDTLHPTMTSIFDVPYYLQTFVEQDSLILYRLPNHALTEGETYTLRVTHPGFEDIHSTAHLPLSVAPDSVWYTSNQDISKIFVRVKDIPGKNFYALEISQEGYPLYFRSSSPGLPTASNSVLQPGSGTYDGSFAPFSDALFQHGEILMELETYSPLTEFRTNVVLYHLEEAYFRYEYENQRAQLNFDLEGNPFGNPKPTSTNITNGYGILAAASLDTLRLTP